MPKKTIRMLMTVANTGLRREKSAILIIQAADLTAKAKFGDWIGNLASVYNFIADSKIAFLPPFLSRR